MTDTAATEPEVGSPAWELRRKVLWDQRARDLMAALVKYEYEHPADAICLGSVLAVARTKVDRA